MKRTISTACLLGFVSLGLASEAFAICTKPVGTYAGVFSGAYYSNTGALLYSETAEITVTISATGSGTETEKGKRLTSTGAARYSSQTTFTAANNVFTAGVCRGVVTTASGQVYFYSSTKSGDDFQFINYTNNTNLLTGTALLKKV